MIFTLHIHVVVLIIIVIFTFSIIGRTIVSLFFIRLDQMSQVTCDFSSLC